MTSILCLFYNWSFATGLVTGVIFTHIYRLWHCRQLDRMEPQIKHKPPGVNRMVVAGLITFALMGYILLKAQQTQDITIKTNDRLKTCTVEFQRALKYRSDISAQDVEVSNKISDVRSEQDEALGRFLERRLNPPPEIAAMDVNDPRRVQWKDDITFIYAENQAKLRKKIDDLVEDRKRLLDERSKHPIPEVKC